MDKELDLKDLNVMLSYEWSRLKFVNLSICGEMQVVILLGKKDFCALQSGNSSSCSHLVLSRLRFRHLNKFLTKTGTICQH